MIPGKVLIVNDGTPLLKTVGGLLADKGYPLSLTDSPEDALVWLTTRKISLVVMKLNGQPIHRLAVLHFVKEFRPGTRLIIMGHQAQLPAEIFEIEADDYVILPCRMAEIWRRLSLCLEAPASKPKATGENLSMHPVNQAVLYNLGLMFHDMRGLLTSITEGMKLMERRINGKMGQKAEAIFQKTFQKTLTLTGLTEEFLQKFQKPYKTQTGPERLDLRRDIIDPVVQEFGEEFQNRRITLVDRLSSFPDAQPRIQGDRVALKSVFRNLLHNAITHGGSGCSIYLEGDEDPRHFRLHVQNSGSPIPLARQARLFSGGNKDRGNGQGVGLALGRAVMRSQGGDICYESCQRGSSFIMSLPRA